MKETLRRCIQRALFILIIVGVGVTPVLFLTVIHDYYELPKVLLLRCIVAFMLSLITFYLLFLMKKQEKAILLSQITSPLGISLIAFFLTQFIAFLYADDPIHSFFGVVYHYSGFSLHVMFLIFIFAMFIASLWRPLFKTIMKTIVFSSLPITLLGLLHYIDIFPFIEKPDIYEARILSTFGQPNLLAFHYYFVIYASVYLFLRAKNLVGKILYGSVVFYSFVIIVATLSRSGWLGLGISLFWVGFVVALRYRKGKEYATIAGLSLVSCCTVLVTLNTFQTIPFIQNSDVLLRLAQFFDARERWDFWTIAWRLFLSSPIIGHGQDAMILLYQHVVPETLSYDMPPDQAHNIILEIALSSGLIGVMAFLCVVIVIGMTSLSLCRRQDGKIHADILTVSAPLLAFFVGSLLNPVSVVNSLYGVIFIILLATTRGRIPSPCFPPLGEKCNLSLFFFVQKTKQFFHSIVRNIFLNAVLQNSFKTIFPTSLSRLSFFVTKITLCMGSVFLSVFILFYFVWRFFLADMYYYQALDTKASSLEKRQYALDALKYNPYHMDYQHLALLFTVESMTEFPQLWETMIAEADTLIFPTFRTPMFYKTALLKEYYEYLLKAVPLAIDYFNHVEELPRHSDGEHVGMVSSYDRSGGNDDGFRSTYSYLRREGNNNVLADLKGTGVITRIWMTYRGQFENSIAEDPNARLQFYFDGEEDLRI